LRIVMSSGLDFEERSLAGGADAFLQKPYMPNDLIAALRGLPAS
jgi:CheY-like chemotaxis protein